MIDSSKSVTGKFAEAFPTVRMRLNGFLSAYDGMKIGATTNAPIRWSLGYAEFGWAKMVILYRSRWAGSTRKMERELIAYAQSTNFRLRPENILPGGESIRDDAGAYSVYVVVR